MKKNILLLFLLSINSIFAQNSWKKVSTVNFSSKSELLDRKLDLKKSTLYALDITLFKDELLEVSKGTKKVIKLPSALGNFSEYHIQESSNFSEELNPKYGFIKSYDIKNKKNDSSTGKLSIGNDGVRIIMHSSKHSTLHIDPYTKDNKTYISYLKEDISNKHPNDFECLVDEVAIEGENIQNRKNANDGKLRTYRLALACTGEYAEYHINDQGVSTGTDIEKTAAVLSAMNTSMTEVNAIFERELAVKMNIVLVGGENPLIYLDPDTDNFTNNTLGTLIGENQSRCDQIIGNANYDIGHNFCTGRGGLASLSSVCVTNFKASGVTGVRPPIGYRFNTIVAHEMGHQFGTPHTFNSECRGNRTSATAVEPGSGSTIMGYAGVCDPGVQSVNDDYFHSVSLTRMWNHIQNTSCPVETDTGNTAPIANAGSDFSVPKGTPLVLKGSATDVDGTSSLTYCWEQINTDIAIMPPVSTSPSGPTFRSLRPTVSSKRYLPALSTVISGTLSNTWEVLPSVAREMDFSLVVRDNAIGGGSSDRDDIKVTIIDSQPFTVNDLFNWGPNTSREITWNVNDTNIAPINCQKINILLSTDGGVTFPTELIMNTDNDGSETITLPNLAFTDEAIIMIEAADNIFYNISKKFAINNTPDFALVNKTGDVGVCKTSTNSLEFELGFTSGNGFSDTVTLSVDNAPANAVINFDNNNFTGGNQNIILTISNLDNVASGSYTLSLKATSTSLNKSIDISLGVNDDVCSSTGSSASQISTRAVTFNTIDNSSTKSGGYSDFKSISTTVKPGEDHQINVNVNTTSTPFEAKTTRTYVWIDWNQNCQFDANEEYDLGTASATGIGPTSGSPYNLTIPNDAKPGSTTFRVTTKISSEGNPNSCETDFNGEVEDYSIFVDAPTATISDFSFDKFNLFPNPSSGKFNLSFEVLNTEKVDIKLFDLGGRLIENLKFKNTSSIFSKELDFENYNSGIYLLRIKNGGKQTVKKLVIK